MEYDIVTVGGGLAGAALAKAMAEQGSRVLILEREKKFKDRVRGEGMHPWGTVEARELGIYDEILNSCGFAVPHWRDNFGTLPNHERDLTQSSPHRVPELCFSHPEMQEVVLDSAERAGAEVRRGARVIEVTPGSSASVRVMINGRQDVIRTRLVAGADGRNSSTRAWAGFKVQRDPLRVYISGLLLHGMQMPEDAVFSVNNPPAGEGAFMFPIGKDRFRAYYCFHHETGRRRLSGPGDVGKFLVACARAGTPAEWLEGAEAAGPLATFKAADQWVDHPYESGVVLVGDAAATPDPSWGCGLSLVLRGVRLLRDNLVSVDDWDAAGHAYAKQIHKVYCDVRRLESWMSDMFYDIGSEADARRERAYPLLAEEPRRWPDLVVKGPNSPSDEEARRRFFAED